MSSVLPEIYEGRIDTALTRLDTEGDIQTGIGNIEVRAIRVIKQIDPETGEAYGYQKTIKEIIPPQILPDEDIKPEELTPGQPYII